MSSIWTTSRDRAVLGTTNSKIPIETGAMEDLIEIGNTSKGSHLN